MKPDCRQLVTRARKRVREQRRRFIVDRKHHRQVLENFLAACVSGDPSQLMALLQHDAVLYSDGGGKVRSAINPLYGADHIARFFAGLMKAGKTADHRAQFAEVNGEIGALIYTGDQLISVITLELAELDRIKTIFVVSNPEKLQQTFIM